MMLTYSLCAAMIHAGEYVIANTTTMAIFNPCDSCTTYNSYIGFIASRNQVHTCCCDINNLDTSGTAYIQNTRILTEHKHLGNCNMFESYADRVTCSGRIDMYNSTINRAYVVGHVLGTSVAMDTCKLIGNYGRFIHPDIRKLVVAHPFRSYTTPHVDIISPQQPIEITGAQQPVQVVSNAPEYITGTNIHVYQPQ